MKFILFYFLTLLSIFSTYSQSKISYELISGINFSKYTSADLDYKTGFQVGAKMEMPISKIHENIYINSGLILSQKGGKNDDFGNVKINAYYMDLPIHIGAKQKLSNKFSILEEVGPYFGLGLFGKTKGETFYPSEKFNYNTFSSEGLRRFDFGLGFKVGTEFIDQFRLTWGLDFGVKKVHKNSNAKNFNTYISLSYILK